MVFRMIAALILGVGIGLNISIIFENKKIAALEELATLYEEHETELRDRINFYKNGMNETLKQNIDLKRRLNNGNSRRI